jgi:hypothetical protein
MAARKKSRSLSDRLADLVPSAAAVRGTLVAIAWLGAIGGGLYGAVVGIPKLRAFAVERSRLDPGQLTSAFQPSPAWMPAATLRALSGNAREALGETSALDAGALERAHQGLLASGWFERIEQVQRSGRNELTVTAEFRVPFALIRSGEEDHLVDRSGRRLALAYAKGDQRPPLPLIEGVALPKPAEPGQPWVGGDVRAALHLAALVRDRPWFANGHARAIDASRYASEGLLLIVTERGGSVLWGSDPNDRSIGEMPPERKLAALDALYRDSGSIDDANGRALDLRFDVVTLGPIREP